MGGGPCACFLHGGGGDAASSSCFLILPHPSSSFPPLLCAPASQSTSEKIDRPLSRGFGAGESKNQYRRR